MALDIVALPYPYCEIGGNECIEKEPLEEGELEDGESECIEEEHLEEGKTNNQSECVRKEPLEEGEIEDDEFVDEGLHAGRCILPEKDLFKTPKRKRRRKTKVLKKRKLQHAASFEGTMKDNCEDGTFQTSGHELFVQGKSPFICSNDTPSRNCDESLAHSDSSRQCSDPNNDEKDPKIYRISSEFHLGIKIPFQKNMKCKQKKLVRKIRLEKMLCKDGPFNSKLKTKFDKFSPKNKNSRRLYMQPQLSYNFNHTGTKCIKRGHKKFRNETFREALKSLHEHLKTAPKKITSNFPQLITDREATVVCTKNCHNKSTKKIPSLLEMVVPFPAQFLAKRRNFTVNGEQSTPSTYHMINVDETKPFTLMPSSLKKETFSSIQQRDMNRFVACSDCNHDQTQQILSGKKGKLSNEKEQPIVFTTQNGCAYDYISAVSSLPSKACTKENQTGTEDNSAHIFPHNLPKMQQELFLRIQQKQRKPLDLKNRGFGDQDKTRNEEDAKETVDEQNWYPSDEDDDSSLVDVLRNLPRPQSVPSKANISSINTSISNTSLLPSMIESSGKLLCSVRELATKSVQSPHICDKFHTVMQILASQSKENVQPPVLTNLLDEKTVTSHSSLGNGKDFDLRETVGMPFRPTSLHKPEAEINASLNSHAPLLYKLIPITVPPPDYFGLRAFIPRDPRLHRTSGLYKGANMSKVLE
jgi:hypothetical protein